MNLLGRRDAFLFSIYKILYVGSNVSSKVLHATYGVEVLRVAFCNIFVFEITFLFNFYFTCYLNQFFGYFFLFCFFCIIVFVFFFFSFIVFPRELFDFDRHENYLTIDSCFHSCIAILLITEYQNFIQ